MPVAKQPKKATLVTKNKKPSALDIAITQGKKLPSKNKKPGRYLDK